MPSIKPAAAPASTIKAQTQMYAKIADQQAKTVEHLSETQNNSDKVGGPASTTNNMSGGQQTGSQQVATQLPDHMEQFAKKEAALRAREAEFKAKEAALESKVKEAVDKALSDYRSRLKTDTLNVLNDDVQLTYDELVQQAMNQPDPNARALDKRLAQIEENQKRIAEESKKAAEAERQAAVKQIRYDVEDYVNGSGDEYETIKATDSYQDVTDLIVRVYDEGIEGKYEKGTLLSVDKASKIVENELFEEAIKIANLGKVKAKLQPQLTTEVVSKQQKAQPATTLTNSMTSTKPMSARERAIAVMEGRIKR